MLVMKLLGSFRLYQIRSQSKKGFSISERTLLSILKRNKDTIYGQKYNFDTITNHDMFRSSHPLTRYDHFDPYIKRSFRCSLPLTHPGIAEGEQNVLTKDKVVQLGLTSGTSGSIKMIPTTPKTVSNKVTKN
jgi:auxin responsive GH3 family protein